jgi:hypothetical protein
MAACDVKAYGLVHERSGNASLAKYVWQVEFMNIGRWPPHQAAGRSIVTGAVIAGRNDDSIDSRSHVMATVILNEPVHCCGVDSRPRYV